MASELKHKSMTRFLNLLSSLVSSTLLIVIEKNHNFAKAMAFHGYQYLLHISVLIIVISSTVTNLEAAAVVPTTLVDVTSLNRSSFPEGFVFGTGSSNYQFEGAVKEDGRGEGSWDYLIHKNPGLVEDGSNADVAVDQYHLYKEDVQIMKYMNTDSYRFSISWPRILPNGNLSGGINKAGIKYYNDLIDELHSHGLEPFVTLFHWDLPQVLKANYGGFLSPKIVKDFQDFADVCFQAFGHKVKYWITFNEPWSYSMSYPSDPYAATHYQLLAHAVTFKLYKEKYQASQKGVMGISINSHWFLPYSNSSQDVAATQRYLDFMFGWFMDPLTKGKYPEVMVSSVGSRLPSFTAEQSKLLIGSYDFIGINYYTSYYTKAVNPNVTTPSYSTDTRVSLEAKRADGRPIGPLAASSWLNIYPRGIKDLLVYVKENYNDPLIFITENGMSEFNDPTLSLDEALLDTYRVDYYYRHLFYVSEAIKDGVKVKGYFAWALLDNFEWNSGYTVRFGIVFVDYKNNLKRHLKQSGYWFRNFLQK